MASPPVHVKSLAAASWAGILSSPLSVLDIHLSRGMRRGSCRMLALGYFRMGVNSSRLDARHSAGPPPAH
jgi:hypothetical protein